MILCLKKKYENKQKHKGRKKERKGGKKERRVRQTDHHVFLKDQPVNAEVVMGFQTLSV